jgi:hypothetical protein
MKPLVSWLMPSGVDDLHYYHIIEKPYLLRLNIELIPGPAMHNPAGIRHVLSAMTCPVAGGQYVGEASSPPDWLLAGFGIYFFML